MLLEFPIKFNDEEIPFPDQWTEESSAVESVHVTEAGTDQLSVIRYDKLNITCAFNCSHRWASKFKAYSRKETISVSSYDLETSQYKSRNMRIRHLKADLVHDSNDVVGSNGLWIVSFILEEF